MHIELGSGFNFGWVIIAIAMIMAGGIYISYRKNYPIKIKYIIAVIIMLIVGVKFILEK
ncbi:hypothetical protein ACR782_12240 [Sphingobacterium spiritivorum]|uniref:hypothetical protein n=1 Tax=Sphingobacterium spiritivorum TaxID=258 RepID=UPI003DA2EF62